MERQAMQKTAETGSPEPERFVTQDGVTCPGKSPWHPRVSMITGLPFVPIVFLAVHVLAHTSIPKLILWIGLLLIFAYPLRYLVCARCPYYGQKCSSGFGTAVPRMFKKQEGKSMLTGLWLDVVMFGLLLLIPLPDMWRWGGVLMTLAWLASFFLFFAVLTRMACSVCPFTFCPIGRGGKAFWNLAGRG
jgi:hypothetical protein